MFSEGEAGWFVVAGRSLCYGAITLVLVGQDVMPGNKKIATVNYVKRKKRKTSCFGYFVFGIPRKANKACAHSCEFFFILKFSLSSMNKKIRKLQQSSDNGCQQTFNIPVRTHSRNGRI